MKKIITFVLIICLAVGVTACSQKKEVITTQATTGAAVTSGTEPAATGTTAAAQQETPAQTEETTTVFTETYSFSVPEGSKVTVNGTTLDNPAAGSIPEIIEYSSRFVDDIPDYVTYTVDLAPGEISLSGTDADGNKLAFKVDGKNYTGASIASQDFIDDVSELVEDGLYCWGLYFINKAELKRYVYYDSELFGMIFGSGDYDWINNTFYNYEYISDYDYSELKAENYRTYGDECFTVDVSYKLNVYFDDPDRSDPNQYMNATMVWLVEGDSWSIADVFNKEEIDTFPAKDGVEIININEKTFTGKMFVVKDPSRVFCGVIDDLGSDVGAKMPSILRQYSNAGYSIIGGINGGDFIDTGTHIYTGTPLGLVISEGEIVYADEGYNSTYRIAGITDDGEFKFGYYTANEAIELGFRDAIHCETDSGPFLVEDGHIYDDIPEPYEYGAGKNARTAIGQREDGAILLLCANGRQANSLGATFYDLAEVMLKYGAVNAAAMDGGSSSQMGYEVSPGSFDYINHPFTPAYGPRACPTFWLIK